MERKKKICFTKLLCLLSFSNFELNYEISHACVNWSKKRTLSESAFISTYFEDKQKHNPAQPKSQLKM